MKSEKPSLDIILGMGKPKGADSEKEGSEEEELDEDPQEAAFETFADAIKNGDSKAGVDALKVLMDLCSASTKDDES